MATYLSTDIDTVMYTLGISINKTSNIAALFYQTNIPPLSNLGVCKLLAMRALSKFMSACTFILQRFSHKILNYKKSYVLQRIIYSFWKI